MKRNTNIGEILYINIDKFQGALDLLFHRLIAPQDASVDVAPVSGSPIAEHALEDLQAGLDGGANISFAAQLGIDLHEIHALDPLGVPQCLHDADALAEGETATDGGTGAGRHIAVQGVDVEANVDLVLGIQGIQSHLNDLGHSHAIDCLKEEDREWDYKRISYFRT